MQTNDRSLNWYLNQPYPYTVVPDPEGGFVILFPDLPGCMTQVEAAEEIAAMAEDARAIWIETEFERGADIPLPSGSNDYSGKFVVRVPRSLHRALAEMAEREGVSMNAYVTTLLSRGDAQARIERRFGDLERVMTAMHERLPDETPVRRSRRPTRSIPPTSESRTGSGGMVEMEPGQSRRVDSPDSSSTRSSAATESAARRRRRAHSAGRS